MERIVRESTVQYFFRNITAEREGYYGEATVISRTILIFGAIRDLPKWWLCHELSGREPPNEEDRSPRNYVVYRSGSRTVNHTTQVTYARCAARNGGKPYRHIQAWQEESVYPGLPTKDHPPEGVYLYGFLVIRAQLMDNVARWITMKVSAGRTASIV